MIHPTAVVDPSAQLDDDVEVGPYAIIGADVSIGQGTWIGPHALVSGPTVIGRDNRIFQFASVGEVPQDKKYGGERTRLTLGDRNVVRESATLHRGTVQGGGETRIGNDNLFMAYTHVAHDCIIGDQVIMANAASLGGHVVIEDWAILGGFTVVHQFCRIGAHSFSAMGSVIGKDVPPYITIDGHPAVPRGINSEGLKRRHFSSAQINAIRRAYRLLYLSNLKLDEANRALAELAEAEPVVGIMTAFLNASARSIVR